jgi:transcriptional regulator with XRE-family HTH domain
MSAEPDGNMQALGGFLRAQRQLANLSLRQLSALTEVSNPYLSQLERGLHEPSVRVLRSLADALNVSAETLLEQAGLMDGRESAGDELATERAIRADARLSEAQKRALLIVYRSYVELNVDDSQGSEASTPSENGPGEAKG